MLAMLLLIVFCICSCIFYDLTQCGKTCFIDGTQYRYTLIGTDVASVYHDTALKYSGTISKNEMKKSSGDNALYAWVKIGEKVTSWKEEPLNKNMFLNVASDSDKLPKYLQEEGVLTRGQYREKYGI